MDITLFLRFHHCSRYIIKTVATTRGQKRLMTTTGVLIFPFSDLFLFPIPMQRRPRDEKYLTSHFPLLHSYAIVECLPDHI